MRTVWLRVCVCYATQLLREYAIEAMFRFLVVLFASGFALGSRHNEEKIGYVARPQSLRVQMAL